MRFFEVPLLIACTKATTLVVVALMHVPQSNPLTKVFVASGLFWFLILLVLTFSGYLSRPWLPAPEGWRIVRPDPKKVDDIRP